MQGHISVEVERRNFVKLISLGRAGRGNRKLTTIEPRQNRAVVKVYLDREQGRILLYEFDVRNIPPRPEKPDLYLQTEFDGKRSLRCSLFLNNRLYEEKQFDLKPYMAHTGRTVLIAAASLVASAALIVLILWAAGVFSVSRLPTETAAGNTADTSANAEDRAAQNSSESAASNGRNAAGDDADSRETGPADTSAADRTEAAARTEEENSGGRSSSDGVGEKEGAAQPQEEAGRSGTSQPKAEAAETESEPADTAPSADREGELLTLTETIQFLPDDTRLTREASRELDRIYRYLQEHPDARLTFTGHTALFGTESGRSYISRERAENTKEYLSAKGWEPDTEPEIRGKGAAEPLTFDPQEQDKNRRVVISITVEE